MAEELEGKRGKGEKEGKNYRGREGSTKDQGTPRKAPRASAEGRAGEQHLHRLSAGRQGLSAGVC